MKKFLCYFTLETGVYLSGIMLIVDLFAQFVFMYRANSFMWFEYNYPIIDFTKTIMNIFHFFVMAANNNQDTRVRFYFATLVNTIFTGISSAVVFYLLKTDEVPKYENSTMNIFLIIFIFGYVFQIYVTFICKSYSEESFEKFDDLEDAKLNDIKNKD